VSGVDDLAAFLRAQWAVEEKRAKATESGTDWRSTGYGAVVDRDVDGWNARSDAAHIASFRHEEDADHAALWSPGRVLTDLAVKHLILDEHAIVHRGIGWLEDGDEEHAEIPVCGSCVPKHSWYGRRADVPEGPCRTVRLLAEPYEGEDGYKQEWKP
jgi:hypothetical protein